MYIYGEKIRVINIPIGAQAQQGNVTQESIWSSTRSFWDRTSNYLAWKRFSQPPSPFQVFIRLQYPVALAISPNIFHQDQD